MKELEQLKNQFDKLNEELEKIDSIGIIRLESIISELESIKKSAKGIVENPGKFSEDIILLSERAIQLTKDVDALSKMVKTAYDAKNKLKAENERDIKSVRDTISRNQEALTEAQVREQIIEGRLKALEERLKYLESSKKTLIEGGNLIVKKTNKKEKEEKPEEKEEKVESNNNKVPQDGELVTVEHPTWNIPKFWNPDLTEDQYKYALSKGISEPYGEEYVDFIENLGLEPEKRAIFWNPLLTEEQILDALSKDIYQPYGPQYNKFLNDLGLSNKYDALLPDKENKKVKPVEKEEESDLINPLEKIDEPKEEVVEEPKRKRVFITDQLLEDEEEKKEEPKEEVKPLKEEVKEEKEEVVPEKEEVKEETPVEEPVQEEPKEEMPEFKDEPKEEKVVEPKDVGNLVDGINCKVVEASDSLWSTHIKVLDGASKWLYEINQNRRAAKIKQELPKEEPKKEEKPLEEGEMKISLDNNNPLLDRNTRDIDVGLSKEELDDVSNRLSESDVVDYLRR